MHLCSGNVTLPPEEFHNPKIFPQSDLEHRADSRWALPQIFSYTGYYIYIHLRQVSS